MPRRFVADSVGYIPPDGATRNFVYNTASDVTQYTDENGSVHANTFDPLGRKTQCLLTLASGVIGTTKQTFQFDGLSRMTQASDFISTTEAKVDLCYDSLGRVLEDSQVYGGNTRNATQHAFESHPAVGCTFPQGRQVTNSYDLLYRRNQTSETSGGANIVDWEFFGPSRTAEWQLGSGMYGTHLNNARTRSAIQEGESTPAWGDQSSDRLGYDGAGRLITKRYLDTTVNGTTHVYDSTSALAGQTTAYDKGSNKLYERSLQAASRSSLYQPIDDNGNIGGGYDSINRLLQYQRGTLKSTGGLNGEGGGEITTAISLPGTDTDRYYDLDGLGNWKKTVYTPVSGSETTEKRQHNYLNQITKIDSTELSYDDSGNLLDDGTRKYEWDAFNRLTKVYKPPSTPVLIGEYTYDALGRRVRKVISNGGLSGTITNGTTGYLYHQGIAQCCEERDGSNSPTKQYVWGHYIDELIQMLEDPSGTPAERYLLSDTLYRSMCLTDNSWSIVEANDTDVYGKTLIYSAAGTGGDWWADDAVTTDEPDNEFIFTGRRYEIETIAYFFRARSYIPAFGRFTSRDPENYTDGMNLFRGQLSESMLDPQGTQICPPPGKNKPFPLPMDRVFPESAVAEKLLDAAENMRYRDPSVPYCTRLQRWYVDKICGAQWAKCVRICNTYIWPPSAKACIRKCDDEQHCCHLKVYKHSNRCRLDEGVIDRVQYDARDAEITKAQQKYGCVAPKPQHRPDSEGQMIDTSAGPA